jgi:glyoxylase-like metal-dependent hydrolase (beta-lactamase superfamily II)
MKEIFCIELPLEHPSSVNAWLLPEPPATLIDPGPRSEVSIVALEESLKRHGVGVEDLRLVLATHHHHDHVGLAPEIRRRSGAEIALPEQAAAYCNSFELHVAADRGYSRRVMAAHGVPPAAIDANEGFWTMLGEGAESFTADRRLRHGERVFAGGRTLEVVFRPGHSTSDTLFVDSEDRLAFVGDHLLAEVSSNTEMYPPDRRLRPRPRTRLEYLGNLRRTAEMPLDRLLTGHGAPICDHVSLIESRLAEHATRCERIAELLGPGPQSAYELAGGLWSSATVAEQPLLVVWEVLGHLDLMANDGAVDEIVDGHGIHRFRLVGMPTHSFLSTRSDHSDPASADLV